MSCWNFVVSRPKSWAYVLWPHLLGPGSSFSCAVSEGHPLCDLNLRNCVETCCRASSGDGSYVHLERTRVLCRWLGRSGASRVGKWTDVFQAFQSLPKFFSVTERRVCRNCGFLCLFFCVGPFIVVRCPYLISGKIPCVDVSAGINTPTPLSDDRGLHGMSFSSLSPCFHLFYS